jgi:two-component system, OmpR family, flagellar system response regulator FtcR
MYVIVDNRDGVTEAYANGFNREGIASICFTSSELLDWLQSAPGSDMAAIDAILVGHCDDRMSIFHRILNRFRVPIVALNDVKSLTCTLDLFESGVDDVVHAPVHVRELMARTASIRRRIEGRSNQLPSKTIQVYFDGRDPSVGGEPLMLPRRELRILEYLVDRQGKWLTKTQIFSAIYGIYESNLDENVIESHISKLRKKLRGRLGYDPIISKRYVGYRFDDSVPRLPPGIQPTDHSPLLAAHLASEPVQHLR